MRSATPVGALIRDRLGSMHRSQSWLAEAVAVSEKHMTRLIVGDAAFSPALAVRIEQATGLDADVLITAQGCAQVAAARGAVAAATGGRLRK